MLWNKNNLRSVLTTDIASTDTAINITSGEWIMRGNNMVACLEHYENEICTKREIIKITAISTDTLTITRAFASVIINDETKETWQIAQNFVAWDFLSLYLSKELRESLTDQIYDNSDEITTMQNNVQTLKNCIDWCCCNWITKVWILNDCCFCNWWFWNASDWDCIMQWNVFLCADRVYNFRNLTICAWACVRFEGQGVPIIKVYDKYVNNGVIDTRAWFVKNCECSDQICFLRNCLILIIQEWLEIHILLIVIIIIKQLRILIYI